MEVQAENCTGTACRHKLADLDTGRQGGKSDEMQKSFFPYMNTVYDEYGEETEFVQYP